MYPSVQFVFEEETQCTIVDPHVIVSIFSLSLSLSLYYLQL